MIRLKIILQSKIFYLCFIIFTLIYCFIVLNFKLNLTKNNLNTKCITGVISNINYKDDMNIIEVKTSLFEKVLVYDYDKSSINIGYKIKVEGTMIRPYKNSNFYLFNYYLYLKSINTHYIMKSDKIWILNKANILYSIKRNIINRINKIDNPYLNTFILGDNSKIDSDVLNSYRTNGISHLFALSGMHIGLIVLIIELFLKEIHLNNKFIIIIVILFYLFLTNYSKSIIRAGILYIMLVINKKYKFRLSMLKILVLLLCISLIINPYNLYNISFIFTYLVTISLILNHSLIDKYKNYFIRLIITSFIAFMVTIPIMINNYFSINFLGIILNIIFIPLVSLVIFPLSIVTFIIPSLNNILDIFILMLENISLFFSNINIFNFTFCHMNIGIFLIYYILIIFILIMLNKSKYVYIMLLVIVLIIHNNYRLIDYNFYCITFDVNQGDSSLLSFPNNKGNIIIDTGGSYNNISNNILIPSLKSRGIKKINFLIISHGDFDHMGEAINLVNNFKVEKVIFNCGPYNDLEQELIKVLDKKKIKYFSCIKELNIDKNKLYFLQTKEYDNENDNSNVIYTEIDSYKFMFMGDASITTEKEILDKYNLPNIDVLKVGHHGSKTSSSKEFINEINPKYSVISVGKKNRYGHPNKEVLNILEDTKVYRTDQDGSIMFKIKNNKLKIETCIP